MTNKIKSLTLRILKATPLKRKAGQQLDYCNQIIEIYPISYNQ